MFRERLDIVGWEETYLFIDLSLPPFPLLAQHSDNTAFMEAQLIRGLSSVGVEGQDQVS